MNETSERKRQKASFFSVAENWKYIAKYLGFNASLASPCSSYDSSETFQSENFEYESPTNGASPSMKGNHDNPTSPHTEDLKWLKDAFESNWCKRRARMSNRQFSKAIGKDRNLTITHVGIKEWQFEKRVFFCRHSCMVSANTWWGIFFLTLHFEPVINH